MNNIFIQCCQCIKPLTHPIILTCCKIVICCDCLYNFELANHTHKTEKLELPFLTDLVNHFPYKCNHCDKTMERNSIYAHLSTCFRNCPFAGCPEKLTRENYLSHQKTCNFQVIKCCGQNFFYNDYIKHKQEICETVRKEVFDKYADDTNILFLKEQINHLKRKCESMEESSNKQRKLETNNETSSFCHELLED